MFMPNAPSSAALRLRPDPDQGRPAAGADSRVGRVLALLSTLIAYGRGLAGALHQRAPATGFAIDARGVGPIEPRGFGTIDVATILVLINRGLMRALALRTRLLNFRSRAQAPAASHAAPRAAAPRKPRAEAERRSADAADAILARMPTMEEIAADVQRRPIGAVIADICRDLGIVPSQPQWNDMEAVLIENCGSLAKLFRETCQRISTTSRIIAAIVFAAARAVGEEVPVPAHVPLPWPLPVPAASGAGPP